ncbi:hypothetical protein Pelo_18339 [Pelomyxa schiedti]|nr:hypothetical protein Pelo_18339 [Pelomyxa schiedti]
MSHTRRDTSSTICARASCPARAVGVVVHTLPVGDEGSTIFLTTARTRAEENDQLIFTLAVGGHALNLSTGNFRSAATIDYAVRIAS